MSIHQKVIRKALLATLAIPAVIGLDASAGQSADVRKLVVDQGGVDAATQQTATVYLKMRDKAAFDVVVKELYDPASPKFHKWLSYTDLGKYAPTASDLQTVRSELERRGLKVVSADPQNFSIRVKGTTGTLASAFQTQLHRYSFKSSSFQGTTTLPKLTGAAGELVASVAGLERHTAHPQVLIAKDPLTGATVPAHIIKPDDTVSGLFGNVTNTPMTGPQNFPIALFGGLGATSPSADYQGVAYDLEFAQTVSYSPTDLQEHYGLSSLIQSGFDGTGQTIALLDAYGYPAARDDANVAASAFGLPLLTDNNFQVVYPEGQPQNAGAADLTGWTGEIALDIQAAHALAPGAKIVLVASAGQDNEDQIASLEYIIQNGVANIVSCSFENDSEIVSGTAEEEAFNNVLERAAALGIAVNVATGDAGDQGLGTPLGAVSVPSNSPYATAVGGTSILNNPVGGADVVTGWETSVGVLSTIAQVFDPPSPVGFQFGAGGGESLYYAKPAWQAALPGAGRQVPDVSALGDPNTGFSVVVTTGGQQLGQPGFGGTSLATPLFSAIWAIANQYNGKSLGQAAPTISQLQPGQIRDVSDTSELTPYSLTGVITETDGTQTSYASNQLLPGIIPAIAQANYLVAISSLHNFHNAFTVTFGAGTSLTVGPGWDNVSGYGEPNGLPFIQGVGEVVASASSSSSSSGSSSSGSSSSSSSSGSSSGGTPSSSSSSGGSSSGSSSSGAGSTATSGGGGGPVAPGVLLTLGAVLATRRIRSKLAKRVK